MNFKTLKGIFTTTRVWLISFLLVVVIFIVISTAALVRHALNHGPMLSKRQATAVIMIAEFPSLVKRAILTLIYGADDGKHPLLIPKKEVEKLSWERIFPARQDNGYLLFSGFSQKKNQSIVQLIRISDGAVLAEWIPDWDNIYSKISDKKFSPKGNINEARAVHPVLLDSGDIIFNSGRILTRINLCQSAPEWLIDRVIHHSNEISVDKKSIWAPSTYDDFFSDHSFLKKDFRDDSIMRVSLSGQVLENHSFSKILIENGLRELLLGFGGEFNADPIHINQISEAPSNTLYWKRGDLLISTRHLSSVFIYRPSTKKIIWHQQGPWMRQHSAHFVNDHQISVFSNNVITVLPDISSGFRKSAFLKSEDMNEVIVYDFATRKSSQPFKRLIKQAQPRTFTEGRAQILPDGGLFIEESNKGRHLRFTKDKLLWSRVNDFDKNFIGIVSWSRYLTAEQVRAPLAAISSHPCSH
jgi:hypothetical protein